MSDYARLEEKLAKLKAQELSSRRGRTLRMGSAGPLAVIVTEMGETILPRRLTFAQGDAEVSFAVANRRCQAVLAPVAAAGENDLADIAGEAIPDVESPIVGRLKDYLTALLSEAGEISVQSSRLGGETYASDVGVPVAQLARAWDIAVGGTESREPDAVMGDFLAGLDGLATAWLHIVGEEVVTEGGAEGARGEIGEQAAIFLDGYFAKFDRLYGEEAGAVFTAISGADNRSMAFAELGEQTAFVVLPTDQVPAVAQLWSRLTL